jgi:hypothetical protein
MYTIRSIYDNAANLLFFAKIGYAENKKNTIKTLSTTKLPFIAVYPKFDDPDMFFLLNWQDTLRPGITFLQSKNCSERFAKS